jgi:hydroxymethylbilane synthase
MVFDPRQFVPAPGQGTLVLEGRIDSQLGPAAAQAIGDKASESALRVERAVVGELGADCHAPVGVYAVQEDGRFEVNVFVGLPDGSAYLRDQFFADDSDPEGVGLGLAQRLRSAGVEALLAQAKT